MHALLTALWLAMQDTPPIDPDEDDEDDDDEGGGLPAAPQPQPPGRWPPRIRLFLPRPQEWQPVPVSAAVR